MSGDLGDLGMGPTHPTISSAVHFSFETAIFFDSDRSAARG
jgi:hypothetical protein